MRILVTEDEPRIRAFVTRALEAEGFSTDGAGDGEEALRLARRQRYDLVVLDLLLPRIDGLAVLRALRHANPTLPVVILSARSDLPTKLRGFDLGANDYVQKPFALDELLARIRAQLRRPRLDDSDERLLRAGDLVLDLARHQVRLGDDAVDLTHKEFRLLLYLAERPGEVVSRERLLAEVWGYQFDPCSNVVEVCVRRLRKKLGPGASIETVRTVGYRLAH
jgi:two-component system, OmpR family, copper resistance phosphate regulon response regulator CusR